MKEKIISLVKKYVITLAVMGLAVWLVLLGWSYSPADSISDKYLKLSNAFCIPGVVAIMLGVLVWISTTGFFDAISYGCTVGLRSLLPFMNNGIQEKFYDYKVRKNEKRAKGYSFLFISGAVFFAVSIVFTILFNVVQ